MPRTIELGEQELVARFTGLVHYESLTEEIRIPYASIVEVSTDPFVPPKGTQEIFGTHVPFTTIYEGRFSHGGEWFFLSLEDRRQAVTLRLSGFNHGDRPQPLHVVVLGSPDPTALARSIRAKLPAPSTPP